MDLIAVSLTIHHSQRAWEGGITLDQQDCQPLEEVPDGLVLVLPRGPGLSSGQLLKLEDSLRMNLSSILETCEI